MAREVRLWEWLRDGAKGVAGLHMRRVENQAGAGDPDVDGCFNGHYFEMELKGCNRPRTPDGKLVFDIRQSQVIWHRRRMRAGGNLWLYIRVGVGKEVARYLVSAEHTARVQAGMTETELAAWAVLPTKHTFTELLSYLVYRKDVYA